MKESGLSVRYLRSDGESRTLALMRGRSGLVEAELTSSKFLLRDKFLSFSLPVFFEVSLGEISRVAAAKRFGRTEFSIHLRSGKPSYAFIPADAARWADCFRNFGVRVTGDLNRPDVNLHLSRLRRVARRLWLLGFSFLVLLVVLAALLDRFGQ